MAEDHVEFLKEYNEWIAQRKLSAKDLSPEAFLIDRAKDEALDRIIEVEMLLDAFESVDWADEKDWIAGADKLIRLITGTVKNGTTDV